MYNSNAEHMKAVIIK